MLPFILQFWFSLFKGVVAFLTRRNINAPHSQFVSVGRNQYNTYNVTVTKSAEEETVERANLVMAWILEKHQNATDMQRSIGELDMTPQIETNVIPNYCLM